MNSIHLPLLPDDIGAETALTAMRWLRKAAAIRKGSNLHLGTAGAVVVALARRVSSFSNVPSMSEVREVTSHDISRFKLDIVDPHQTESNYEQYLDHYGTHYAVVDSVPGLALAVTRHEHESDDINKSPSACYCVGVGQHEHNSPPTRDHDSCYCTPLSRGQRAKLQRLEARLKEYKRQWWMMKRQQQQWHQSLTQAWSDGIAKNGKCTYREDTEAANKLASLLDKRARNALIGVAELTEAVSNLSAEIAQCNLNVRDVKDQEDYDNKYLLDGAHTSLREFG